MIPGIAPHNDKGVYIHILYCDITNKDMLLSIDNATAKVLILSSTCFIEKMSLHNAKDKYEVYGATGYINGIKLTELGISTSINRRPIFSNIVLPYSSKVVRLVLSDDYGIIEAVHLNNMLKYKYDPLKCVYRSGKYKYSATLWLMQRTILNYYGCINIYAVIGESYILYDDLYLRGYRDAYPKYWRYLFDENDSSYGDSDVAEIIEEARSVWMKRK